MTPDDKVLLGEIVEHPSKGHAGNIELFRESAFWRERVAWGEILECVHEPIPDERVLPERGVGPGENGVGWGDHTAGIPRTQILDVNDAAPLSRDKSPRRSD
jgi:hypothetical protein